MLGPNSKIQIPPPRRRFRSTNQPDGGGDAGVRQQNNRTGVGSLATFPDSNGGFRKAAEQGLAKAQRCVGICCYAGEGVAKDAAEAVKWYRKAAEQGNADAQYNLGHCYVSGEGAAKDAAEG